LLFFSAFLMFMSPVALSRGDAASHGRS
jgi:hypothetical protein